MNMLEMLVMSISSHLHPLNHSGWSITISKLISLLSINFLIRLRKEEAPRCKTPNIYKITPSLRRRFVEALLPLLQISTLSKNRTVVINSAQAIKHLIWIDPEAATPKILSKVVYALGQSQDKPYLVYNCNKVLAQMIYPTLNIKDTSLWVEAVSRCLELSVSAVDVNDDTGAISALSFISAFSMCVPIIDISDATADSPDTYSRLAGELTTIFDTWVLEFLEKIFALMQNLPLLHAVNHGKSSESILLNTALYAYGDVMQQSSPKIEKLVVDRLLRFTKTCIPNATNAIGILCSLIANSDLRLSVFAERSANIMLEELEKGAARNVTNNALSDSNLPFGFASMSDSKFHWHQSILMHILLHSGISILKYKDLVKKVLLESIKKVKSRTGFQWAAKTLSNVIYSLTSVYPLDSRCLTDEAWEKNKTSESPNRHWGSSYTSENACIRWHVCIAEELDYSLELMEIFFDLSIQNLDAWLENFSLEVEYTIEAEKWLEILKRCVLCTYTFMEPKCTRPPGFGRMEGFNIHNNSQLLGVRFINTGSSLDENDPRYPKLQNYLEKACRVLVEVSKRLYSENIENVYLLISAVNSMSVYICDETYCIDRYAGLLHTYRTKKMELIEARNNGKLLRSLIVRRAYALHHLRVMCNFYRKPFGLLEKNICEQIIKWTRCKYSEVRKSAQYSIKASVRIFSFELGGILRTDILNFIDSCCTRMDGLLRKTESSPRKTQENEYNVEAELLISEIKGVLFTLKGDIVLNFNLETWDKKFQLFTSLLCLYKHELRHNVRILCHDVLTELLEKVSWTSPCERWVYYTTFNGISLKNADIYKDVMSSTFMSDHPPNSTGLEKFIEYNNEYGHPSKDKYLSVIDTALEYARTKDTKWITVILVIKFLFLFLRTTEDVPEELVSFALSAIVSDIRTNRLLGLQLLTRIIVIFKFKRRQKLPPWKIKAPPSPDIIKQCLDDRPLSKDMFENTMFNDKSSLGWLCWPSKCTFRYGGRCSYNIECGLEDDKAFKSLKLGLSSEDFWRKFINFFSEESEHADSRVSDKMLPLFFRFFFGLFVTEHLSIINPIIDELVVNSNDPDKQKFLAQFVGGMIRGSKHWGWSHIERLWDWATDIIKKGLFSSGRQIFGYWTEYSIFFTLRGRDPLRMFTLIKIILDEKIDMNPKMVLPEVQRLTLIMLILLLPLSWRLVNSRKRLLQQCASQLDPAYDIMSEYIGSNISSLLRAQFYPGHKDTISLLKWCVTLRKSIEDKPTTESRDIITHTSQPYQVSPTVEQSGSLAEDTESSINFFRGGSPTPDIINKIITCFRESLHGVSETDPHHPNNAAYLRICKIICALTTNEVTYYSGMGMHLFIRDITPPLLSMLAYHDIGLHAMATRVVNSYPYLFYTPYTLNEFVKIVSDFFEGDMTYTAALTNRRKAHIRILTILQAFTFNQMFVLMGEHIEKITEIVIGSLYYPHVEVRSLSAVTLSCIIVCFYQNNVDRFICRFKERLEYYGKPSSLDSKSRINMTREQVKERSSDVNLVGKHGSILGLCAVMNAFPYTVKPWMADLLTTLAGYSNECHPISVCCDIFPLRRTISDHPF